MRRRLTFAALMVLTACFSAGCWDRHEIDTLAFVTAIGLDRVPADAEDAPDQLLVSTVLANPKVVATGELGGGGGNDQPSFLVSARGRTVLEALENLQAKNSRNLFLAQAQAILLGEDLAKNGVREALDLLQRHPQIRRTTPILVTEGYASLFMESSEDPFKTEKGRQIADLTQRAAHAGLTQPVPLGDFLTHLAATGREAVAPFVSLVPLQEGLPEGQKPQGETGGTGSGGEGAGGAGGAKKGEEQSGKGKQKEARITGLAVFRGDRMVGRLTEQEAAAFSYLKGFRGLSPLTLQTLGNDPATLSVKRVDAALMPRLSQSPISVAVNLRAQAQLLEQTSTENLYAPHRAQPTTQVVAQALEARVRDTIRKLQSFRADAIGVGESIYRSQPARWNELKHDWPTLFSDLPFNVHAQVNLLRTGLVTQPVVVSPNRGGRVKEVAGP